MTSFSTETFNFEEAPDPPANHPSCRSLQWNHQEWNKLLANTHVLTRQVRETFLECLGFYPTIDAPKLLSKKDFAKFCYYAYELSEVLEPDGSTKYALDDLPEGTVPLDYEDDPEAWWERQKQVEKRAAAPLEGLFNNFGGEDERANTTNEKKKAVKPSGSKKHKQTHPIEKNRPAEVKCIRAYRKPLSTETVINPSLTSMGDDIRRIIADYLTVEEWQEKLRFLNKSCVSWPKPPPTFQYEVILFHVSNAFDRGCVGIAKTIQDVEAAIESHYDDMISSRHQLYVQYWFLDFDAGAKSRQAPLPIATFNDDRYYEEWDDCVNLHELSSKFLGLKCMLATSSGFYDNGWCSDRWNEIHGSPKYVVGFNWGYDKAWIGSGGSFGPKNPDLDLSRFQVSESYEGSEGDDVYDVYFKYNLPSTNNNESESTDKSWVIFHDQISLWDK